MALSTYAELQSAIANWLNRDDLSAAVPTFIALAEADIGRRLKHWRMETRSTATLDGRFSVIPADWNSTVSLTLTLNGKPSPIRLASVADIAAKRSLRADAAGTPEVYAITGGQFELFPTPDTAYAAELVYLANVPSLSASVTSNWLLAQNPDVYLYGALIQSAPYLKDDQRMGVWASLYQAALDSLNSASDAQQMSGSGLRMKTRGM